jgi:hypothetical protein
MKGAVEATGELLVKAARRAHDALPGAPAAEVTAGQSAAMR